MTDKTRKEQIDVFAEVLEGMLKLWKLTRRSDRESHNKFCQEAGISPAQLSSMLNGRNLPRLDSLVTLTDYVRTYFTKNKAVLDRYPMDVDEFRAQYPLYEEAERNRRVPIAQYLHKSLWRASGYSEVVGSYPELVELYDDLTTADDAERRALIAAYNKAREEYRRKKTEQMQAITVAASLRR